MTTAIRREDIQIELVGATRGDSAVIQVLSFRGRVRRRQHITSKGSDALAMVEEQSSVKVIEV